MESPLVLGRNINAIDNLHSTSNRANRFLGQLLVIEATNTSTDFELVVILVDSKLSQLANGTLRQNSVGSLRDVLLVRFHHDNIPVVDDRESRQ